MLDKKVEYKLTLNEKQIDILIESLYLFLCDTNYKEEIVYEASKIRECLLEGK